MAQHFGWHAWRRPGSDQSGSNHACIGKTAFFSRCRMALEYRDFMAIGGQLVSSGDAYDSRAYHCNFHVVLQV